jgi:hypothetical protein
MSKSENPYMKLVWQREMSKYYWSVKRREAETAMKLVGSETECGNGKMSGKWKDVWKN